MIEGIMLDLGKLQEYIEQLQGKKLLSGHLIH